MKQCPTCNTPNEAGALFCDNCGANLGGGAPGNVGAAPPANVPVNPPPMTPPPVAPPAMVGGNIICPQCATSNVPGTAYCDNCGADLKNVSMGGGMSGGAAPPAPNMAAGVQGGGNVNYGGGVGGAQPAGGYAGAGMMPTPPRIMVGGQPLMVPQKSELIVGRSDPPSGWMPDVDLMPAGGTAEQGVSRRHVKLTYQGQWMLEDLDSTNKTLLRGQFLVPFQKMPVNNGEVIQMGRLQVTFYI